MRGLLLALILTVSPAFAADPVAHITGPTSGVVGSPVLLDVSGSVSDPEFPLQVEIAGSDDIKPALRLWFDASAKPGLAVLAAPRAGSFTVVVVAIGKTNDKTTTRIAAWPIEVTPIAPAPKPPDPIPGPTPEPVPPTPAPVTGNLWGALILPDYPSVPQSALRTSLAIRSAFAAKNANFRSYLASESEVQGAAWKTALTNAGGAPAVIWIADGGKVVKTTPAATEASILADLKALRGGN